MVHVAVETRSDFRSHFRLGTTRVGTLPTLHLSLCLPCPNALSMGGGFAIEFERQHGHGSTRGHSLAAGRLQAGYAAVQG